MTGGRRGGIAVGTSGWVYDGWRGRFYPAGLASAGWFDHYVARFPTVEVNYSFYRLPSPSTVEGWRTKAPPGFRFAVKGSRYVTHIRRMVETGGDVRTLVERVRPLGSLLSVLLWQLPPSMKLDLPALEAFLADLPADVGHAVEFRDASWLRDDVFDVLRSHGVALVLLSSQRMPAVFETTAPFVYVRFHGLEGATAHDYTDQELRPWAEFLRDAHGRGLNGYAYFNNDGLAMAPRNALQLIELLGESAMEWGGEQLALGA